MELRYLGFDQLQNKRAYTFRRIEKGVPELHFIVTADVQLFLAHRVGLQEGPVLCARKLASDLEKSESSDKELLSHELTNDDLLGHVNARALAEARKVEARGSGRRGRAAAAAASAADGERRLAKEV